MSTNNSEREAMQYWMSTDDVVMQRWTYLAKLELSCKLDVACIGLTLEERCVAAI